MKHSGKQDFFRKEIEKIVYPLSYPSSSEEIERWTSTKKCNCYAYIFGVMFSDKEGSFLIPGAISGINKDIYIYNTISLLENFHADLRYLNFTFRKFEDSEEVLKNGEFRVAVYKKVIENGPINYHFVRQDRDGTWSEKYSWNSSIHRFDQKEVPDLEIHDFDLVQVYVLKKK